MRAFSEFLVLLTMFCVPLYGASSNEKISDEQALATLEQRATQAPAEAQCYLYAQLVHDMVEYGARQYAAGNVDKAVEMLKRSQEFTRKIEMHMADNTKKLKATQILLRHAAFRLTDLLHGSSYEDEPLVKETLAQLNQTEDNLMQQVFRK